jgi:hypothetical protein
MMKNHSEKDLEELTEQFSPKLKKLGKLSKAKLLKRLESSTKKWEKAREDVLKALEELEEWRNKKG